ncbi:MAG: HlyC/CorC family transporter [Lachnospiraceae bacterium]|nr:HlyC/CorC family transporter [Lachnospiraceae bacterium]
MIQPLILLIILIFLNAAFASAEIAVISMSDAKLKKLTEEGDSRAVKLTLLTKQPARFLATIQVAITLASLLQSAFAAENFAGPLVQVMVDVGVTIPESVLRSVCVVVITLVLAYFNLVFGELVPKRVAMKKAETMALGMAKLLYLVSRAFAPLVWLLTASTNLMLRLLGMNPEEEGEAVTEEEIRMMLAEGNEKGTIPAEENEMIQNVFEFNDISVEEICTHRRDVAMLPLAGSQKEWEEIIGGNRHTYYPVCRENTDDIIGVLDSRDYFRLQDKNRDYVMKQAVEKAMFIPESMKANVLFRKMKQTGIYFAVIIDEYGGMSGIITLHDLMEALVGDLDEKEEISKPADIEQIDEITWRIQGCADLEEVAESLGRVFPTAVYDTFNGYVCDRLGRVPANGESLEWEGDGLHIEVKDVSNHIIGETIVRILPEKEALEEK